MNCEEYVRSRWKDPWLAESSQKGKWGIVLITASLPVWSRGSSNFPEFTSPEEAWQAVYDLTLRREEEIGQVEEEIILLRSMVILLSSEKGDQTAPVYERILARLQSILADKKRGMKEVK